ncbi:MAG TPA: 2-oxo-4-hydroxy-4-carboxy-5-ureidoimidazoline decarboxylase [Polyangiales bacterium]
MGDPHTLLNALSEADARAQLTRCCGAQRWVAGMLARRPFSSAPALHQAADEVWSALDTADYLEAFAHHPQIGESLDALRAKFAATASWSQGEQTAVAHADDATLLALREENAAYRRRFGHIFIVCATGKSAAEMLALLRGRIHNEAAQELAIAAAEQAKITHLRLEKLAP